MLALLRELLVHVLEVLARGRRDGGFHVAAEEDVALPEVPELGEAVADEAGDRDVEDGVELLERLLLGLGQEQQHADEARYVPGPVPRERPLRRPRRHERRPRQRHDRVEEPRRCRRERHPRRAYVERVRFCAVGEGDRLFLFY